MRVRGRLAALVLGVVSSQLGPVALPVLLPVSGPSCAWAAPRAKELKARRAFAAGQYQEALDLFADLYAETLHPVYLRNIGRCHQKMRNPDKAIDAFRSYLEKAPKIAADDRAEVEGYMREMEELKASAAAQAPPPASTTPGPTPLPLPTAPPPVADLGPSATPSLTATASEPANEPPFYKTWWFWTATGAVVAGAVVTAIVLSGGGSNRADCPVKALDCQ